MEVSVLCLVFLQSQVRDKVSFISECMILPGIVQSEHEDLLSLRRECCYNMAATGVTLCTYVRYISQRECRACLHLPTSQITAGQDWTGRASLSRTPVSSEAGLTLEVLQQILHTNVLWQCNVLLHLTSLLLKGESSWPSNDPWKRPDGGFIVRAIQIETLLMLWK